MLFNCIAASPGWGWGESRGIKLRMASSVVIEQHPDWCLTSAEDFLWILIDGMLDTENSKWPFSLLSLKWSMSSLKGDLSKLDLKFKCKDSAFLTLKTDTSLSHWRPRCFVKGNSFCYKFRIQPVLYLCWRLDGKTPLMWYKRHLNGRELLGLEPGALSLQRSAGECVPLSFSRKLILIFFSIQIEIIGKFEQHKHTGRNDFRKLFSQQFTTE